MGNRERFTLPAKMPAAPAPAIALPMTNAAELGAAPQTTEPTSNNRMVIRKTTLTA